MKLHHKRVMKQWQTQHVIVNTYLWMHYVSLRHTPLWLKTTIGTFQTRWECQAHTVIWGTFIILIVFKWFVMKSGSLVICYLNPLITLFLLLALADNDTGFQPTSYCYNFLGNIPRTSYHIDKSTRRRWHIAFCSIVLCSH